jgi:ribosomal protein S27AE
VNRDGDLPWGLCCPDCEGLPSRPRDGLCVSVHHTQGVEVQVIAGFLYPVCSTCGPDAAYSQHDGQQLLCGGCGQGFPGWFYPKPPPVPEGYPLPVRSA